MSATGRDRNVSGVPLLTLESPYAAIRLNRSEHRNRIETQDIDVLQDHFSRVEQDPTIRVAVLEASGPAFCSGYSLDLLASARSADDLIPFEAMVDRLETLRLPTVCAVQGSVYGGGTDLALACDFRIGVPGMELRVPAAAIGVHYYFGGLRRFASRVGLGAAKRLFLLGEPVSADELLRIGFLDEIVAPEQLPSRVREIAAGLAAGAPSAVQGMKAALNRVVGNDVDHEAFDLAWRASIGSDDLREGLAARRERRQASFRDR